MTSTTLPPPRRLRPTRPTSQPVRKPPRWFGVAFGVLLGLAAVCHGCHLGDHDDELSLNGVRTNLRQNRDDAGPTKPGAETPGADTASR